MQTYVHKAGDKATIRLTGRFDFNAHQSFRDAYQLVHGSPRRFVVDLGGATYLDSSALGMLLLLRDHAGSEQSDIRLINCNADVRKVLCVSNFDQLFKIQ